MCWPVTETVIVFGLEDYHMAYIYMWLWDKKEPKSAWRFWPQNGELPKRNFLYPGKENKGDAADAVGSKNSSDK